MNSISCLRTQVGTVAGACVCRLRLRGEGPRLEQDVELPAGLVLGEQEVAALKGNPHAGASLPRVGCQPCPQVLAQLAVLGTEHIPAI